MTHISELRYVRTDSGWRVILNEEVLGEVFEDPEAWSGERWIIEGTSKKPTNAKCNRLPGLKKASGFPTRYAAARHLLELHDKR